MWTNSINHIHYKKPGVTGYTVRVTVHFIYKISSSLV